MKRIILFFGTILFVVSVSCKSQKKSTGPEVTSEPTVYKGVTDQECAVEVAFGSFGAGIDGQALDKVMTAINSRKLAYTSKSIGREGETRICLPLKELKGAKKTELVDELKKIAKEAQLVSVSIR